MFLQHPAHLALSPSPPPRGPVGSALRGPYPSCGRPTRGAFLHALLTRWPQGRRGPPQPPAVGLVRPTRQTRSSLSSADQLVQSQQRGGARCGAGPGAGPGRGRPRVPGQACEGARAPPPPPPRLSPWKPGGGGRGGLEPAALVWISNSMLFSQKPLGQTFQVGKVEGKAAWPLSGEALAGRQRGGGVGTPDLPRAQAPTSRERVTGAGGSSPS